MKLTPDISLSEPLKRTTLICALHFLALGCGVGSGCDNDPRPLSDVSLEDPDTKQQQDVTDSSSPDSEDSTNDTTPQRDPTGPDTRDTQSSCKAIESEYCQRCTGPASSVKHPAYMCGETGGKPIDYSSINWCFQVPESGRPSKTASDFRRDFPDGAEDRIISNRSAPDHSAACGLPYNLFARPGESVTVTTGIWVPEKHYGYQDDDVQVIVSGFLDYMPVDTEVVLRTPDRKKIVGNWTDQGVAFETKQRLIQLDMTFPASAFEDERMYEGALSLLLVGKERIFYEEQARVAIHYGSTTMKERPCFESPTPMEWTDALEEIRSQEVLALGGLGKTGKDGSMEPPEQTIEVTPGESLEYTYHLYNANNSNRRVYMTIPTLQGTAVGSPKAFVDPAGGGSKAVLGKQPVRFDAPAEPGTYHLKIVAFTYPYLLARDPHACRFDGIDDNSGSTGSQTIRIKVKSN